MKPIEKFYFENLIAIRQALSSTAMIVMHPLDPNFVDPKQDGADVDFQEYIALEFHMSQAYYHQQDYVQAILFAEYAKDDQLALIGMRAYDPQMLPFYSHLRACYQEYAIQNYRQRNMSSHRRNTKLAYYYGKRIADIFETHELSQDHEIIDPRMPNVHKLKFGRPFENKGDVEQDDETYLRRFRIRRELFSVAQEDAWELLDDGYVDRFTEEDTAGLHLKYATQLFLAQNYKDAIYHAKRAERIGLQLARFDYASESMFKYYDVLESFYNYMSKTHGAQNQAFIHNAEHYARIGDAMDEVLAAKNTEKGHDYTTSASTSRSTTPGI